MVSADRRWQRWALDGAPLLLLAVLFFVDLFLPWQAGCFPFIYGQPALHGPGIPLECGFSQNGLGGSGYAAAAMAVAVALFEGLRVGRLALPISLAYRSLISTALAAGVLLFTILDLIPRFGPLVSAPSVQPFGGAFAWLALLLALMVAAGGLVHWGIWCSWAPVGPEPPVPPPQPPPDPRRCPGCGRRNAEGAAFCAHCGRPLAG